MGTYSQILDILRTALKDAGSKAALQRKLGAMVRSTFLKAIEDREPQLPRPEILCPWLDTLDVEVRFRKAPEIPGSAFVRLAEPEDLATPPADRPDRGQVTFRMEFLADRTAEECVAMTARLGMPPTVSPGALLLLDTGEAARIEPREGALHLVMLGGRALLRRIQRASSGWILASDTHGIVPIDVQDGDLVVLGRVIAVVQPMP